MNPVIEWLRSPEGEEWSRDRHANSGPAEFVPPEGTLWRATGPLAGDDPCGRGPVAHASSKSNGGKP